MKFVLLVSIVLGNYLLIITGKLYIFNQDRPISLNPAQDAYFKPIHGFGILVTTGEKLSLIEKLKQI